MRPVTARAEKPDDDSGPTLRSVVACNLGVCLEGFDFIAYSAFSVIIGKLFFPTASPLSTTLFAFGALGVAYAVRPLGGIFWGIYADRRGRRLALSWISILMAFGTAMIAFVPTYGMIGVAAPVLMLLGRAVQGFAAAGEFASATAMLVELAPPYRRAFYASTQMASQAITLCVTSGLVLILSASLSPEALEGWGWRAVFAAGTLIGPLGLYMRAEMVESPEFAAVARRREKIVRAPLAEALSLHGRALLCMAGLVVIGAGSFYLIMIFLPIYASRELGLPIAQAQLATVINSAVQVLVILGAGAMADRLGAIRVLLPAAIAYAILSYPLFSYLMKHPSFPVLLFVQFVAAVTLGFVSAPLPSAMSVLLPPEIRSSGIGFIYNVVGAVFGGLGPFFITLIVAVTGDKAAPAYWAMLTGVIGAAAAIMMRVDRRRLSPGGA